MGYYTKFELEMTPDREKVREAIEMDDDLNYAFNSGNSTKWYDHEKDLKEFSLKFPDVLFKVYGEGEEAGDLWIKYFKNGKIQRCPAKITFDDFDESKLED